MKQFIDRANMLVEALPYIQRLFGKTIVIKYGGAAMQNEELTQKIMQDVTLLKFVGMNPILVHGGGPDINHMLCALDVEPKFIDGLRVTDDQTMEVVQMVLAGKVNKQIVAKLNGMGASAIGLCGIDGNTIRAEKAPTKNGVDLGNVGKIIGINTTLLNTLAHDQYIPVIAPIGVGENGESYNINADTVAGAIATALKAEKLMFLTDTDGIRENENDANSLLYVATKKDILNMIEQKKITGGMLPKVNGCLTALEHGVNRTHILNGTIPHPIILEIFTDSGIGTMVTN
ncbi:MAG: acetylglutamate kinase [Christensenellaceae bacterium]